MKLITLGIVANTISPTVLSLEIDPDNPAQMAYIANREAELQQARQKASTDDEALKVVVRGFFDLDLRSYSREDILNDAKMLAKSEISRERLIRVLKKMVRESMAVMKNNEENQAYVRARADVDYSFTLLEAFPDHDILPFVKECLQSELQSVRAVAIKTYANMKGVKAIPFLRETIEKGDLEDKSRSYLYWHLERVSVNLENEKQTDDAKKMNAFIQEMKQAEKPQEKGEN